MEIIGIGTDIVDISRIENALERHAQFATHIFTEKEQAICFLPIVRLNSLAGRFAAKEAVSKALGTGIGKVSWREIEILQTTEGAPFVVLHGAARERANALGVVRIHCSISHEKTMATAMIVLEG